MSKSLKTFLFAFLLVAIGIGFAVSGDRSASSAAFFLAFIVGLLGLLIKN